MAYLDNAATTFPKPDEVYDFIDEFYRKYGSSFGRGSYKSEKNVSKLISDTREKIKKILHCENKLVVFTPTATIALNIVIQGLIKQNKKIYITPLEHNAVTRILEDYTKKEKIEVIKLSLNQNYKYDLEKIKYQFDDKKPDLIIMSHVSNVTGLIAPIEEISILAKKYGSIIVIDMAQSAGLVDTNVGLEAIDFAVFAGHKTLYAPTGVSGFVMKRGLELEPVLFGGTGFDSANQDMPNSVPERYEVGTLNTHAISGLYASLKWLEKQGVDSLYKKEQENRAQIISILSRYDFIKIICNDENAEYVGIVSFVIEGISSESASNIFDKHNVSVRTGLHCAPLAHKFLKTFPSGTIRISTSYFTTEEDFKDLISVLDYIKDEL